MNWIHLYTCMDGASGVAAGTAAPLYPGSCYHSCPITPSDRFLVPRHLIVFRPTDLLN